MIDYIKYRVAFWHLSKQKHKISASYAKDISFARGAGKKTTEIMQLESEAFFEEDMINEEISILVTKYLVSKATKHFIAVPSREEENMWEQCCKVSDRFVLTNSGISALRSAIRTEAKERRDLIIPVITALTGIIGAVIGLIAVLNK